MIKLFLFFSFDFNNLTFELVAKGVVTYTRFWNWRNQSLRGTRGCL